MVPSDFSDHPLSASRAQFALDRTGHGLAESLLVVERDLAVALARTRDSREIARLCLDAAITGSGLESGGAYLAETGSGRLVLTCHRGLSDHYARQVATYSPDSPEGNIVAAGKLEEIDSRMVGAETLASMRDEGFASIVVAPVMHEGLPIGCLCLASRRGSTISAFARHALEAIASQMTAALERARSEAALQRHQAELHAIYDNSPIMMCIVDRQRGLQYMNRTMARYLGQSNPPSPPPCPDDILRCAVALDDPQRCGCSPHCQACTMRLAMLDTLETGQSHQDVEFRTVLRCIDGPRDVFLRGATALIDSGDKKQLLVCLEDVTHRRLAEEAVRASEARYRLIMETANEGILSIDADNRTTFVNRQLAAMLGYTPDEMIGRPISTFLFDDDLADHQTRMDERAPGISGRYERRFRRKDGSECWTVISAASLHDAQGRFRGSLGMLSDITAKKADENRLARMELALGRAARLAMLGELAAGIAHEINQPLCAIVNFAKASKNVAASQAPDLAQITLWCDEIATAANRSGEIVRRMLDFARKQHSTREAAAVGQLVDDALLLVRYEARAQKTILQKRIPDQNWSVLVDPVEIHQVLVNLLRNGIEACQNRNTPHATDRGTVTVSASCSHDAVEISVSDNGSGLPDSQLVAIFQPFFVEKPQSLGLGLAISRTIIQEHGGRIWVTRSPEGGLAFHFTLPLRKENPRDVLDTHDLRH